MQPDGIYRLAEFIQIDGFLLRNGINTVPDIWLKNNRCASTTETDISLQTCWPYRMRAGFRFGIWGLSPYIRGS